MTSRADLRVAPVVLLVLVAYPLVMAPSDYTLGIVTNTVMFVVAAYAWNVISGIGGQFSLGHAVFWGVGAYTSSLLFVHAGLSPWIGMLAGSVLAAALGVAVGYPAFRLGGIYFAMVTFVLGMVFQKIATQLSFTGGDAGLNIPLELDDSFWSMLVTYQFTDLAAYYYIGIGMLVGVWLLTRWLLRSRFGYQLRALSNDQTASEVLGVDSLKIKLIGFAISAAITAIVGSYFAQRALFIDPRAAFEPALSLKIALIAIVGGAGRLWGPLVGGFFVIPLSEWSTTELGGAIPGIDTVVYGLALVVVALFLPRGLVSIGESRRRRDDAAGAVAGVGRPLRRLLLRPKESGETGGTR